MVGSRAGRSAPVSRGGSPVISAAVSRPPAGPPRPAVPPLPQPSAYRPAGRLATGIPAMPAGVGAHRRGREGTQPVATGHQPCDHQLPSSVSPSGERARCGSSGRLPARPREGKGPGALSAGRPGAGGAAGRRHRAATQPPPLGPGGRQTATKTGAGQPPGPHPPAPLPDTPHVSPKNLESHARANCGHPGGRLSQKKAPRMGGSQLATGKSTRAYTVGTHLCNSRGVS